MTVVYATDTGHVLGVQVATGPATGTPSTVDLVGSALVATLWPTPAPTGAPDEPIAIPVPAELLTVAAAKDLPDVLLNPTAYHVPPDATGTIDLALWPTAVAVDSLPDLTAAPAGGSDPGGDVQIEVKLSSKELSLRSGGEDKTANFLVLLSGGVSAPLTGALKAGAAAFPLTELSKGTYGVLVLMTGVSGLLVSRQVS
ncbi:MAG TPA: hypothetical protein VMU51_20665 [Mycobacteriales bacterium]|nr:hypothetical protein [Mycobacteriales bacterium]